MRRVLVLALCFLPSFAVAQDGPVTAADWAAVNRLILNSRPSMEDRVNQVFMLGSVGMSSIALGLTMSCTGAGTCSEINPVMRKFLSDGPVATVVVKSAMVSGMTYLAWRTQKGKRRTLLLAGLFAWNAFDAIHDIHVMRQMGRTR